MDIGKEESPDAWDESVSSGYLFKTAMNTRDTANVIRKL